MSLTDGKSSRCLLLFLTSAMAFCVISGCNGPGASQETSSTTPSIISLSPSSATTGGPSFTLTINGANFASGATLGWTLLSGSVQFPAITTTFVDSTKLTAQIPAALIASPTGVQVFVLNPFLGAGSVSAPANFTINLAPTGVTQTITLGVNGAPPNGPSSNPVLSTNGEYIAFASQATNLVSPNAQFAEVYVRDTCISDIVACTPATQLVSAITNGSSEGNALGGATPSIGNQGRFVGFLSAATNLVTPNTQFQQAYLRDTCADAPGCVPITVLASVLLNGGEPNAAATAIMTTSNNCYAVFASAATNVVPGVTAPNQVYLSSCSSNGPAGGFTTSSTLVSADNSGVPANQGAQQPAVDSAGRFAAFASTSTNLPGSPGNGSQQIYFRDTCLTAPTGCTPATTLISIDASGKPLIGDSQLPAINSDGHFVAFTTQVPLAGGGVNPVVYLYNSCQSSVSNAVVTNCTPASTLISVATGGTAANGPSMATQHAISDDGRFTLFSSTATNLAASTSATTTSQVYARDTCVTSTSTVVSCTPSTIIISIDSSGALTGGSAASISGDGHVAAFQSIIATIQQIVVAATGF
jgi:hypothetical protein